MKFYKKIWNMSFTSIHNSVEYPCIIIENNGWDDWGYKTLFQLYYCDSNYYQSVYLGDVKLLCSRGDTTANEVEDEFECLDDEFCSLGQSIDYYRNINKLEKEVKKFILDGLNDVIYHEKYYEKFYESYGFRNSLMRSSEATRIARNRKELINDVDFQGKNEFKFEYISNLKHLKNEINLDIDFSMIDSMSDINRINAIVGKNGTGKTTILSNIAKSICYGEWDKFSNKPAFSKSIALSYSIFDEFFNPNKEKIEKNDNNEEDSFNWSDNVFNSEFNYIYCGMRNGEGIISTENLEEKLNKSLEIIIDKNRQDKWKKILLELFESNYSYFVDAVFENRSIEKLSSGQSILVVSFTEVIANIENESLILFDEPETHLHPNAISNLMRMLNKLLNEFNSYCIMTTHSPMIIQEIPSKYVRVIERNNDMAFIKRLSIESFGENITNIINDVFRVSNSESNYKFILENIYNSGLGIDEIEEKFDNNLSFNALTFLNILDTLRKDV